MSKSSRNSYDRSASGVILTFLLSAAVLALPGCAGPANNTNTASNMNINNNANMSMANANASAMGADSLAEREPDRYSTTMTITGQYTSGQRQGNIPTLQFDFARMNESRRWTFNLPPPAGQVVYLERGGLKYLLLPARNQYVEITPEDLGFQLGNLMTPVAVIERLKSGRQYEDLGTEQVNGRAAHKYRFTGAADTRTQAGTVQADSFVYVDQQTGLPLRSEINTTTSGGPTARIVTETRDIQLNPDPSLFEVPTNLKKVTTEELKQQVRSLIDAVQVFAEIMRQQQTPPASAQPQPSNANANR